MIKLENSLFMELTDANGIKTVYTHAGRFHADDVFSTALLLIINQNLDVVRTFNPPEDGFHYDIGGGPFDHHNKEELQYRDEEHEYPYASFGLLWRELGPYLLDEKGVVSFDECLVKDIDATDNLGQQTHPNSLSASIGMFNLNWDEPEEYGDNQFWEAVQFAQAIILRKLTSLRSKTKATEEVNKAMELNENILILDRFVPWKDAVLNTVEWKGKFAIYPSLRGGWNVEVIPMDKKDSTPRIPFPEEWWGHPDVLPDGCTFCHHTGFLLAVENKDRAIEIATALIDN